MQIEAGKYYRTRDGRKVGPMKDGGWEDGEPWTADDVSHYWGDSGKWDTQTSSASHNDLVAEWEDEGPVRTVTRREANPGTYGPLRVLGTVNLPDCSRPDTPHTKAVDIELTETPLDADQLAVLVSHLQEIIGALREQ